VINLRILNVGHGDLTIKFDGKNPQEKKRGKEIVTDLLRKGYALMVEAGTSEKGPLYRRVKSFDPETSEYIVFGDVTPADAPVAVRAHFIPEKDETPLIRPSSVRKGRTSRVPSTAPTIAVGRTAGGYDPVLPNKIRRVSNWNEANRVL
jgi:hypothetical protein